MLHVGDYKQDGIIQNTDYDLWVVDPVQLEVYTQDRPHLRWSCLTDQIRYMALKNEAKIGTVEIGFD